jgi:signal transduction histidine kinase/ligand-binding sensor domain-containing protein
MDVRLRIRFPLLFIQLVAACIVQAQPFHLKHYQVEKGLSNNTVFCTVQDHQGFMWMGTKDGLNRFDGKNFKIFRNDPDNIHSIGDNFIRSLLVGQKNILYAGTRNGLFAYDERTEKFNILFDINYEIRDLAQDKNGNVWFVAGQKLFRLGTEKNNKGNPFIFHDYTFTAVACSDIYGIWAATADGFLLQYNNANGTFGVVSKITACIPPLTAWIEKIVLLPDGRVLAGTANCGAVLYNPSRQKSLHILDHNVDQTGIFVRDFLYVNDSTVWIATESGIFIYNLISNQFTHEKKELLNPYALSDNAVYTLCRDSEGGIWAGTYFGGINYFAKEYAAFKKWLPGIKPDNLSGQAVREILEDARGRLWIGTEDGGINLYDPLSEKTRHFQPHGNPGDISYRNIHGLLYDDPYLWIGTFEHGLDLMDTRTGNVIKHYPLPGDTILKSTFFVVLAKLKNNQILCGTRRGMYRFNPKNGKFNADANIPQQSFVHCIYQAKNQKVWVGTLGDGLFRISSSNEVRHFTHDPTDKHSLPVNAVTTVFEDSNENIWVGTEGGGLCRFNPETENFKRYSIKEGLPSNTIFSILQDDLHNLWISTSNGLVKINPENDSLKIFTADHGLLSNQFNYNSGFRDSRGIFYFGSAKGLISFRPDKFSENLFTPPIHITGLNIAGKEIMPGMPDAILSQSLQYTNSIKLAHHQNSFSIDFASLSFIAPDRTEYKYIMEGLEKEWTHLKTNRKVYFTNLIPGKYTFKVMAANSSGFWSGNNASLQIVINPPWWSSTLAYTLYTLSAIILLAFAIYNYHNVMINKAHRKLEHLQHEKDKEMYNNKIDFFTNVAHEIKTPLTLIKAPLEQILKSERLQQAHSFELSIMERNTNRLIELTNQLLDFRKIESDAFRLNISQFSFQEFLNDRYQRFKPLAQQKNINIELNLPIRPIVVMADSDAIQKITDNLFSNAISYCSNHVWINVEHAENAGDELKVYFFNDGPGIPDYASEQIFQPFYRLPSSKNKSGTGIGLALAKSLAQLHQGDIVLWQTTAGATCFLWTLPQDLKTNRMNPNSAI